MKEFKGIWTPYEIVTDIKLKDKDKKFMSQDKANKIKKSDCLKKELEKFRIILIG